MVILGASGGITLSSAMMEDVGELVGVSNRLPKSVSKSLQSTFAVSNPNAHAQ